MRKQSNIESQNKDLVGDDLEDHVIAFKDLLSKATNDGRAPNTAEVRYFIEDKIGNSVVEIWETFAPPIPLANQSSDKIGKLFKIMLKNMKKSAHAS